MLFLLGGARSRCAAPTWKQAHPRSGSRTSFQGRTAQLATTPSTTNGSPATNSSAASRLVKIAMASPFIGSPMVTALSSKPRPGDARNDVGRGGARLAGGGKKAPQGGEGQTGM